MPLVSVIVPTRNRAGYLLRRSIDSVLAQTFRDFELIVVDDASSDETPQLLATFTDPRLRVIRREQSSGVAAARNAGVREARGEFVAFNDDDDVWLARKLERQVEAMQAASPDVGLCLGGYMRWWKWGAVYIGGPELLALLDFKQGQTLDVEYGLVATPAWLVRRSLLIEAGAFDERLRLWEDLECAMRLRERCRFIHVDEPLYVHDQVLGSGLTTNVRLFAESMQVLVEKHWQRWSSDPPALAKQYYTVGRLQLQYGDLAEGQRWMRKALALRPRSPTLIGNLIGSRLGQDWHRRLSGGMRRALGRTVWWLS